MKFIAVATLCLIIFAIDISSAKAVIKNLNRLKAGDQDIYSFIKHMMEKHRRMQPNMAENKRLTSNIADRSPSEKILKLRLDDRYHELLRRKEDAYDELDRYVSQYIRNSRFRSFKGINLEDMLKSRNAFNELTPERKEL
ncbi:hypothetical protein TrispH2_012061, partial [Trichoplax sp. H2]